jgi:hypothetical protein
MFSHYFAQIIVNHAIEDGKENCQKHMNGIPETEVHVGLGVA